MAELTVEEYRRLAKPARGAPKLKKPPKYANKLQRVPGHRFDSKFELQVFHLLKAMEHIGELKEVRHHTSEVRLTKASIIYKPDFVVFDVALGEDVWVEAKGFETAEWRIKKRLWGCYGPGRLRIYKDSGSSWPRLVEEIVSEKRSC